MGLYLQCPKPLHIISNADETEIFINHAYGLSKYNLQTKVITLLVGEIDGTLRGNLHLKLIPGPFHTAQTGSMDSLRWLVQDQVLVSMGRKDNEALVIIDLMQKQIYSICSGQSSDLKITHFIIRTVLFQAIAAHETHKVVSGIILYCNKKLG